MAFELIDQELNAVNISEIGEEISSILNETIVVVVNNETDRLPPVVIPIPVIDHVTFVKTSNCSYLNSSLFDDEPISTMTLVKTAVVISYCLLGLLLNVVVVHISLSPGTVVGNFKYFLANLAVINFIFALGVLLEEAYTLAPERTLAAGCPVVGFLFWFGFYSLVGGLLPIPLSRYCHVFHAKVCAAGVESVRGALIICVALDAFLLLQISPLPLVLGDFKRFPQNNRRYMACDLFLKRGMETAYFWWNNGILTTIVAFHLVTFSLNVKMYFFLSRHTQRMRRSSRSEMRNVETRDLITCCLIQTVTPLVSQLPLLASLQLEAVTHSTISIHPLFRQAAAFLYGTNPVTDAVLVLYVVKAYRRVLIGWWFALRAKAHAVVISGSRRPTIAVTSV